MEKMRFGYSMYAFSVRYGTVDLCCFNPTLLGENKLPSRVSNCIVFVNHFYLVELIVWSQVRLILHSNVTRFSQPTSSTHTFLKCSENIGFFHLLAKTESLILRLRRDINRKPFLCCKNEDNNDLQLALTGVYSLTFWQLPLSSSVSQRWNHYDPPCQFQPFSTGLLPFYW